MFYSKLPVPKVWHPLVGSMVMSATALVVPETLFLGYQGVDNMLKSDDTLYSLAAASTLLFIAGTKGEHRLRTAMQQLRIREATSLRGWRAVCDERSVRDVHGGRLRAGGWRVCTVAVHRGGSGQLHRHRGADDGPWPGRWVGLHSIQAVSIGSLKCNGVEARHSPHRRPSHAALVPTLIASRGAAQGWATCRGPRCTRWWACRRCWRRSSRRR